MSTPMAVGETHFNGGGDHASHIRAALWERCAQEDDCGVCDPAPDRWQAWKDIRTFDTITGNLKVLAEGLTGLEVSHAAMESTGVYW